jgi:hypothetical protein
VMGFFEIGCHKLFAWACSEPQSWVARIIGTSLWCPVVVCFWHSVSPCTASWPPSISWAAGILGVHYIACQAVPFEGVDRMTEWIGRQGQRRGADLWFSLPAPLCLLSLLLPPLSPAAPISPAEPISQAYNLAFYMQKNTSTLLQTYVSDTGQDQGTKGPGEWGTALRWK